MFGSALLVQSRGFRFKSRLGRRTNIRWGMMRGLLNDLVEYERVLTTEARAKELVRMSDRVITYGKRGTLRARSWARRFLTKDHTIAKVFTSMRPCMLSTELCTRKCVHRRTPRKGFCHFQWIGAASGALPVMMTALGSPLTLFISTRLHKCSQDSPHIFLAELC
eukprot:6213746-Pleurochrysis_carterae.AAC.5